MNSFEEIKNQTPKDIQIFVEKSFDIADEVDFILEKKNKNRAFLAAKLEKSESEISKWLSGLHNLTIKSISKIEATLGETVISTPSQEAKKYQSELKDLQKKIKRLEDKTEELKVENERLRKMIFYGGNYSITDDYADDNFSKLTIPKSINKVEEGIVSYFGVVGEWRKSTIYRASKNHGKELNLLYEDEKITT